MDNSGIYRISPVSTTPNLPLVRKVERRHSQKEGTREEEFKELLEDTNKEKGEEFLPKKEEKRKEANNLLIGLDISSRVLKEEYIEIDKAENSNSLEDEKKLISSKEEERKT